MTPEGEHKEREHAVAFLTADELRDLDSDSVLEFGDTFLLGAQHREDNPPLLVDGILLTTSVGVLVGGHDHLAPVILVLQIGVGTLAVAI